MKNCTKHFWREKARAPVNVCPFRNRLFCIRSDIHCDSSQNVMDFQSLILKLKMLLILREKDTLIIKSNICSIK